MNATGKVGLIVTICILTNSFFTAAQEHDLPKHRYLWVNNHSSYHIRVFIDGGEQGSVWPGGNLRLNIRPGYTYTFYGQEYQNAAVTWGPWDIYVPNDEDYQMTLYDPETDLKQEDYVTPFTNLYVINETPYDARVYVDGWEKGTVIAGGTFTTTIQGGYTYELYAESIDGEIYWGPQKEYIAEGEHFTWTLQL